jgi:hypothetical protein
MLSTTVNNAKAFVPQPKMQRCDSKLFDVLKEPETETLLQKLASRGYRNSGIYHYLHEYLLKHHGICQLDNKI